MRIVICDNKKYLNRANIKKDDIVISKENEKINNCIGCFNCWIKTPMNCVLKDNISNLSSNVLKCDELIIITTIKNGCYSSFTKKILERIIGYVEPFFVYRDKEIHHKMRSNKKMSIKIIFYNEASKLEMETFFYLLRRNKKNFNIKKIDIESVVYDKFYSV